ncbi:nitrate- and nitrite sensing domain-containing protein [Actinomadura sp. ATCC 31491]|uniref:histidine kinase n=1 Tax=Actinomadura luzonensis TaxID=2805427 RepID=A0ABT0GBS4_9ACTN|nr:nitrate- and nitrite sensing domain-containing protein [Actinomadura luzonensis]MCK2221548.1 nitrate- and nitrite sensing domain-containing protein [Actinomadura luzonensis]
MRTQSAEASADREPHAHQKQQPSKPSSRRFGLGNWHVRSRLIALIVVPTAVAVGLGGLSVITSLNDAHTYQTLRQVAEFSEQLGAVTHELAFERDQTALFIAQGRPREREAQLQTTYSGVDALIDGAKQRGQVIGDTHGDAVRPVLRRLEEIPTLRATAVKGKIQPLPMIDKYSQIIAALLQFHDQVGQVAVDDEVNHSASAMAAIARAKEQASKQRGILASALDKKSFDSGELEALTDAKAREESEETLFATLANLDQLELYRNTVVGRDVDQTDLFRLRAMAQASESKPLGIGVPVSKDVTTWFEVSTGKIDALRSVEKDLASSVILRARGLEEGANRSAMISGGLILLLLLVVISIISLIARSLIRPLRRLRREALDIAGQRLPETVKALRESTDGSPGPVAPISVDTHDEIGEVARAFDEVHREAVRLAGEEARLRSNVNAMFVNLSRRSQTLVERQITLIDGLEQGEQDEQRLGNLFKLDHLATRMRRNSENLLVLAGQEPPRRWSQPVKLVDVARASLSEVENYERVVLQVPDGVSVAGQAVNDVIHLLAELVENALSFSPRETRVTVSGSRIDGGGVMLSITDNGIGMTQDELAQANDRLTEAPSVDVSVSRRMGLFVVARLAHRHGIRVQLRPHASGGLTAMVLIPENMLGGQAPAHVAGMPSFSGNQPPSYNPSVNPSYSPPPVFDQPSAPAMGQHSGPPLGQPPYGQPFTQPPAFAGDTPMAAFSGAGGGGDEPYAGPHPAPPALDWPQPPAQLGPGHPSFPSNPEANGWPQPPGWQPDAASWTPEPRGFDGSDVWSPPRTSAWNGGSLPKRPVAPEPPPGGWSGDTMPPQRPGFEYTDDAGDTGPIPAVPPASAGDDYLPIFAAVESAWFGRDKSWNPSKADEGWSAAEAVVEPVRDGSTAAGLPKRVPKANLVPGSAGTAAAPKGVTPMPSVSPDRVRNRLSSFQQGFRAARDDISEGRAFSAGPRNDEREEGA